MMRVLHQDAVNRIEHHTTPAARRLVMTFTWYGYLDFDTPGFAVNWLLTQGFDVIAFKCIDSSWFQRLDPTVLAAVRQIGQAYDEVVLYGSSMGGFAAIAFAQALGATRSVALSPQFDITQDFDRRWATEAARIEWRYRIAPETAARVPTHIVYDDRMPEERAQVDRLRAALPGATTFVMTLPYAGHPVTTYLQQSQELGPLFLKLSGADDAVDWPLHWSAQRKSRMFFSRLGYHASHDNRPRLAELCYRRAIALGYDSPRLRHQFAALLLKQGRADEAVPHARAAVDLAPDQMGHLDLLARALFKSGALDETEALLTRAIALSPQDEALQRLREGVIHRRARLAARRKRQAARRNG